MGLEYQKLATRLTDLMHIGANVQC